MAADGQGGILKAAREGSRMTQAHLALAAGVSLSTVKRAERGAAVSDDNMRGLCSVLGLDAAAVPRPVDAGPAPNPLLSEFVDLDDDVLDKLAQAGPVTATGRCRADLWVGRPAIRSARDALASANRRACAWAAVGTLTFVPALLTLSVNDGVARFLHRDAAGVVDGVSLAFVLAGLAAFLFGLARGLPTERRERDVTAGMMAALGHVGVAARDAYVGLTERVGTVEAVVIPWGEARVSHGRDGESAWFAVEGCGRRHVVEGLPADSTLLASVLAACRVPRLEPAPGPVVPARGGRAVWRPVPHDYVTATGPGYGYARCGDVVTLRGPGGVHLACLKVHRNRVGVETREPLRVLVAGIRVRAYEVVPGTEAWVPVRFGARFAIVRGRGADEVRVARGLSGMVEGFVASGRHVPDEDASPLEVFLQAHGWGTVVTAAGLGVMFAAAPVLFWMALAVSGGLNVGGASPRIDGAAIHQGDAR